MLAVVLIKPDVGAGPVDDDVLLKNFIFPQDEVAACHGCMTVAHVHSDRVFPIYLLSDLLHGVDADRLQTLGKRRQELQQLGFLLEKKKREKD